MTAVLALPALRAVGDIVAVTLEQAQLAGSPMWVVTVRESVASPPRRRWYPDAAPALAYSGEQAERHGLPLLDLREPEDA